MVREVRGEVRVRNKSSVFILPLIGLDDYRGIIDTYLATDDSIGGFDGEIHVLTKNENLAYCKNDNYVRYREVEEGYLFTFRVPDEYIRDYDIFLAGKYSKMSNNAKKKICDLACRNSIKKHKDTVVYGVLYRTVSRRKYIEDLVGEKIPADAEYSSIIDPVKEIYGRKDEDRDNKS